jgi:hypothetical protein
MPLRAFTEVYLCGEIFSDLLLVHPPPPSGAFIQTLNGEVRLNSKILFLFKPL